MPIDLLCKLWSGPTQSRGYGYVRREGKMVLVHRLVMFEETGVWFEEVHHLCKQRLCIEYSHLLGVTSTEHRKLHTKTACKYGHRYTPENEYHNPKTGARSCLTCRRIRNRKGQPCLLTLINT